MMPDIDIRHISIIDALPVYNSKKEILTVGCGSGNLELELQQMGYNVLSTDFGIDEYTKDQRKDIEDKLNFAISNIMDLNTFPIKSCETVICSEVLEHITDWQTAFKNLLKLTDRRLIITVPWRESFNVEGPPPDGHCNFWTDLGNDPYDCVSRYSKNTFMSIKDLSYLAYPHHVSITKICTKYSDWEMSSRCYMIVVDKNQLSEYCLTKTSLAQAFTVNISQSGRRTIQANPGSFAPSLPPLPFGPPLPYEQKVGRDIVGFVSQDFVDSSDGLKQLTIIEGWLSNWGIRFCAVINKPGMIDAISKHAPRSHMLTGYPTIGFVNINNAVPDEFMNILNSENKFLISRWAGTNQSSVYSLCFESSNIDVWKSILNEIDK
jgi:SAM-dependent methyltransferase